MRGSIPSYNTRATAKSVVFWVFQRVFLSNTIGEFPTLVSYDLYM